MEAAGLFAHCIGVVRSDATSACHAGKVVGAVCHGPAGILEATGPDGKSIISGKKCTGFCNTEEEAVGKTEKVPFLLEDRMKALGGKYEKKGDWNDFSLRDGKLVTGKQDTSQLYVCLMTRQHGHMRCMSAGQTDMWFNYFASSSTAASTSLCLPMLQCNSIYPCCLEKRCYHIQF